MKKMIGLFVMMIGSVQADLITNATVNCTYVAGGANVNVNFNGSDFLGVRGALGSAVAQYAVMTFDLGSQQITNAALRLRGYSAANPGTWDASHNNVPIQLVVLSPNNNSFAEASATFNNQAAATPWKNSLNTDTDLFNARDTPAANWTTYAPSADWANNTWYDISLSANTVAGLEALRSSGQSSALIYIQVQNLDPWKSGNDGVRFYSDDSAYAPELVMSTIPEPGTVSLLVVSAIGLMAIRRALR